MANRIKSKSPPQVDAGEVCVRRQCAGRRLRAINGLQQG